MMYWYWLGYRNEGKMNGSQFKVRSDSKTNTCVCVGGVPVAHLAGTHTAAASGAVGLFDAATCSPDAAGDGGLHGPHPGCSEPTS